MCKEKMKYWILSLAIISCLLVITNSCTKDDPAVTKFEIGQNYGGGIIFYIDSTDQHGLICASYDQSDAVKWSNGTNLVTNAIKTGMGDGKANTLAIVASQGTGDYAAQICNDLDINGYNDWYLPSKSECFNMYFNLKIMRSLGNFTDAIYWSSTEASINNAYSQYSNDGYPPTGGYYKNTVNHVRAIRAF